MAIRNSRKIGIPMVNLRLGGGTTVDERFIISVKTDNTGTSNNDQFTLPWTGNYDVDWGDGVTDTGQNNSSTHTYAAAGTYEIAVTPTGACRILFNNGGDRQKLLEVKNWGTGQWSSMGNAFYGCNNMQVTAADAPDLSNTSGNIQTMFRGCTALLGPASFGSWTFPASTRADNMFRSCQAFNADISTWDTSTFTRFDQMFMDCDAFNSPIGVWNTGNVTNVNNMFNKNNFAFDQNLANWDVTSITTGTRFLSSSGISTLNYDNTLIGWATQSITNSFTMDFGNSKYTLGGAAEAARTTLVSTYGWTIVDGGGI